MCGEEMDSYYAPSERSSSNELQGQMTTTSESPVVDALLRLVGGLIAVLNEDRQIVALNESLLKMLGINDAAKTFGLRPGEALGCVHADDMPGGCGTSKWCKTCGAAIAIVTCLGTNQTVERLCAAEVEREGKKSDLQLSVRATPIRVDGRRFVLLFLQDITADQQRAAFERVFLHDLSNTITALQGAGELLRLEPDSASAADIIHRLSERLAREVELHRAFLASDVSHIHPVFDSVSIDELIKSLSRQYTGHPAACDKQVVFPAGPPDLTVRTDVALLLRVLANMFTNALEASLPGDEVRIQVRAVDGGDSHMIEFSVWNRQPIASERQLRIFQRNFTTKAGVGRGLGTYAVKLIGEEILGGRVWFESSPGTGTTFYLRLPLTPT
ncbi:sensor histidine kinase [candidate division GN15 bacterium]|nr:sensor histidine kinase [candidate division GN15 bacterium]